MLIRRLKERPPGPTIVYVTLQRTAEEVAGRLFGAGLSAKFYHAGMEDNDRAAVQDWFAASDTAIVVIRATRIVGAYEDAFDLLRAERAGMPRNVMLITGPSRSADIEQTLELGAHGPRSLHVLIVDES